MRDTRPNRVGELWIETRKGKKTVRISSSSQSPAFMPVALVLPSARAISLEKEEREKNVSTVCKEINQEEILISVKLCFVVSPASVLEENIGTYLALRDEMEHACCSWQANWNFNHRWRAIISRPSDEISSGVHIEFAEETAGGVARSRFFCRRRHAGR